MHAKTAVLVGSSVLASAAFSSMARAETRSVLASPEPDRKVDNANVRPDRTSELVYANIEGGYATISLTTLTAMGNLTASRIQPSSVSTSGGGAFYGVGGGFRLGFFTVGGRVRGAHLSVGDFSTIDGELGARISLKRVEPYFTFAGGYAKLGSGGDIAGISDLNIHGWNARAGVGVDYYADKNFTIGIDFTGEVLAMARPGIDLSTSPESQAADRVRACQALTSPAAQQQCASSVVHDAEGASAGFASTLSVVMGLHF